MAVPRAVVPHGHGDHARPGHRAALATPETLAIMRTRLVKLRELHIKRDEKAAVFP